MQEDHAPTASEKPKLRGCDVVAVRVDDVAPSGYATDRATVRRKKTGRPVRFELTEQTRQAIDDYLRLTRKKGSQFLFAGRGNSDRGLTTRQYARLVQEWVASIGLDPAKFGTHSLRRTKAVLIYRRTGNLRPHEDREHHALPGHRGRRCDRDRREDRHQTPRAESGGSAQRADARPHRPDVADGQAGTVDQTAPKGRYWDCPTISPHGSSPRVWWEGSLRHLISLSRLQDPENIARSRGATSRAKRSRWPVV